MPSVFDPDFPLAGAGMIPYWCEHMFMYDWTVDRKTWDFKTSWTPSEYFTGCLVESWEWSDPQTMVAHLRQGAHWQDKAPANGREFVADDVVFHYDRLLGTGNGYIQPHPFLSGWLRPLDNVTAQDKYTAVYHFKSPAIFINMETAVDIASISMIELPELCDRGEMTGMTGPINEWKNAVGTGAWMLTEFLEESSLTLSKYDKYWGYDEHYPQNKLPYADNIKMLCIPDSSTAIASLRTGKIDVMPGLSWQQADTLKQTAPDLEMTEIPAGGSGVTFRVDKAPFDDINVRKAMQMALDLDLIAEGYYGGTVKPIPAGMINPSYTGWCTPYDQWPAQLQEEYSYNLPKAKQLLTDAGYPNGFKTVIEVSTNSDMQLLQLLKAQFQDISVDMEIVTYDPMTMQNLVSSRNHEQMTAGGIAGPRPPRVALNDLTSKGGNNGTMNNDPVFDAFSDQLATAGSVEEAKKIVIAADMYFLEQHWEAVLFPTKMYTAWNPELKGYSGENLEWMWDQFFSRLWKE